MPALSTASIARLVPGAKSIGGLSYATYLVADSRSAAPDTAFAAVRTGHDHIADALSRGAPFVISERADAVPDGTNAVLVDDTVEAIGVVASEVRRRSSYDVVGVTGSTGKTLTKDFLAATLACGARVHRTPASYNAELGVPLTILGTPDGTEVLVAELAARRPGEIAVLAEIVKPHVGVITGIGFTHLELFGTRAQIARTKSELLTALPPDGLAVVPSDDDFLPTLAASTQARVVAVGPGSFVRYRADGIDADGRTHGRVWIESDEIDVILPIPGRALMRNAAIAILVAVEYGVRPSVAAAALAAAELSSWRMEIERVDRWTVVNDAYNANPTSVASSLRAVRELAGDREAWAVLGVMAELGDLTAAEHRRAGRLAAGLGYAGVIAVGAEAGGIAEGAGGIGVQVGSLAEAADAIRDRIAPDAVIVVKASRAAGLERLVGLLGSHSSAHREQVN